MTASSESTPSVRPVVGYVRVSTGSQIDGFGLEVQEAAIRANCEKFGQELVDFHSDEGMSGKLEAYDRPGLSAALLDVKRGCDLIVHRLDRLARTLTLQEAVLKVVWDAGGTVFAADVGVIHQDDPDDPMRTFVRQVMGAVSELERSLIVKRLRDGREAKRLAGGYSGGAPGYGYAAVDGCLVAIPEEQAVLRHIEQLRGEGQSIRGIAADLDSRGIPGPKGGRWGTSAVHRIVSRKV